MTVDVLRSCHSSYWRFFANDPTVVTRGYYYRVPNDRPALPFMHDFYSGTWTQGDPAHTSITGPVQEAARPWRDGELDIDFPPPIAVGQGVDFYDGLQWPQDQNTSELRAGIPALCWTQPNVPFLSKNTVTDLKNCCLRTAYCRIIELVYVGNTAPIDAFFIAWLGQVTVTHFTDDGLMPAMTIVTTSDYAMAFVTGTTNFQQISTQATTGFSGPTDFGVVKTIPLWFECSSLIAQRFADLGVAPATPQVLVGHSYGGAAVAVLAIREKSAHPEKEIFVLTFGMPKPTDKAGMEKLETCERVFVYNPTDFICHLPLAYYAMNWFPSIISKGLKSLWGDWQQSNEYLIQNLDGSKRTDHLPPLTFEQVSGILQEVLFTGDLAPVLSHQTREYLVRSCRGCHCPRWPFDAASWSELFDYVCGDRGIRLAGTVIEKLVPLDPCARIRFSSTVINFPHPPPLCLSACLHLATNDHLSTSIVNLFGLTSEFTIAFFVKRRGTGGCLGFVQATDTTQRVVSFGLYLDNFFYAHVPTVGGYSFGFTLVPDDLDWHHLAAVYDGTQTGNAGRLKMFVDGVEASPTYSGTIPSVSSFVSGGMQVGSYPFYDSANVNADVRYILAFDHALSAGHVERLASNTINPYSLDPGWFVPFAEGEGFIAQDYSLNFLSLAFTASATWCGACTPLNTSRIKFHVDVQPANWGGPAIPAKLRLRSEYVFLPPSSSAIPAKLRLRVAPWASPLPAATRSIAFNSVWSQYQSYGDSPVLGDAFTLFFWGKSNPTAGVGVSLSFSNFFPKLFRLRVLATSPAQIFLDLEKPPAFTGEVYHAVGTCPTALGWHLYFVELYDVPTFAHPAKIYVDDQEVILSSSSVPTTFTNAWFGSGLLRIGSDGSGAYAHGKMKNVGFYDGIFTPIEKAAIVACEVDPLDFGLERFFGYELDVDPRAWESITADQALQFHNFPSHSDDVPPLMQ